MPVDSPGPGSISSHHDLYAPVAVYDALSGYRRETYGFRNVRTAQVPFTRSCAAAPRVAQSSRHPPELVPSPLQITAHEDELQWIAEHRDALGGRAKSVLALNGAADPRMRNVPPLQRANKPIEFRPSDPSHLSQNVSNCYDRRSASTSGPAACFGASSHAPTFQVYGRAPTRRVGYTYVGQRYEGAPFFGAHASARFDDAEKEEGSRDQTAAPPALPLRYLDCRVAHAGRAFLVEAVIHLDSELNLISKAFWTALGKPRVTERTVSLAAAVATSHAIDLCVDIGGLEFEVQAFVVDGAPFLLLLGQPFAALAEMKSTIKYSDGTSYVSLTDRYTDATILVPTRLRPAQRTSTPLQPSGF